MSESDKSGKQELTAETKEQIFKWACEIEYENQNESTTDQLCLIAERATLHERSAAQARIAELEAALKLTWLALRAGDTDEQIKAIEQAKPYIK